MKKFDLSIEEPEEGQSGNPADKPMAPGPKGFSLALNLDPAIKQLAQAWSTAVKLPKPNHPLVGYQAELWDPRKPEWAPLDLAVQAAAERGGTTIDEAWKQKPPSSQESTAAAKES